MPQIAEYTSPVTGLRPSETGVEATAQMARRVGAFYNQAGAEKIATGREIGSGVEALGNAALQAEEHREISHGAATFAQINDNLTQQWNDTAKTADPNDPNVAAKFRQDTLEPALDQFKEGFATERGQQWAEARVDSLRSHMFEKTSADMSSLAAESVRMNLRTSENSLSNTAMLDPTSVPHLLENADAMVGGMVSSAPNLKGPEAGRARLELSEKMKESIVKAGAVGAVMRSADPEAEAEKWGRQYPQYINGAELKALAGNARAQIRAQRIDEAYLDRQEKQQAQEQSDKTETDYLGKLYSDDPKIRASVSSRDVVNDPKLNRTAKERMIGIIEREVKAETSARVSNANYIGILSDIRSGKINNVNAIYQARIDGKIDKGDFNQALKDFSDFRSPEGETLAKNRGEFFKHYAPAIDPAMEAGKASAAGSVQLYAAEKEARRREADVQSKGGDPNSVYDPSSPNFFGKPENIARFHVTAQAATKYQATLDQLNLTGPDKKITGVQYGDTSSFRAPPDWQFSASRQQYRDKAGNLYDMNGKPVKK